MPNRYESLIFELTDHVASVTLNRPDALNALDTRLLSELADVCQRVDRDPEIRVAWFTGAGRAFCAGGDVKASNFANAVGLPTPEACTNIARWSKAVSARPSAAA